MKKCFILLLLITISNCSTPVKQTPLEERISRFDQIFNEHPEFVTDYFDFPIKDKNNYGYYMSQSFGNFHSSIKKYHVAEDWVGKLGSPTYSISNGFVRMVGNMGYGWGNVVFVVYKLKVNDKYKYVEAFYAHIDKVKVKEYTLIKRGDEIGTIGTAGGAWKPHLHFELRSNLEALSHGYEKTTGGYLDPTQFITERKKH